ncbi:hypothetical protein [Sutcliffiella rhizosphaerae]|uniref:Streptomycin adenylyltransferase n=1 Tax=Sutcliffiella rhizosphaerae TaxID=2880967 RepID=A0ABM8YJG9_9BACI|nr:hypothetical protein [Sutcliffiella rhizosphaerae]CAG9619951.1 hypothetical protein BACCIP111883_00719 [Sutcliffiella rhizosphaerae]
MGFLSKQVWRDSRLPSEREKLRKAIYRDLSHDSNVLAFFYGGSVGKRNEDVYSDLDLRVVVEEEAYEPFLQNKKDRAKNWGDVLFYEDFPWASYSIAHFRSFIKVDAFYYKKSDLLPSPYLEDLTIDYDPYGFIAELTKQSKQLKYEFTAEDFEVWRGKFFAYLHEVYRRVHRQEYNYAFKMINDMSFSIVVGWYVVLGEVPNSFGDWSKVEGARSPLSEKQLHLLKKWDPGKRDINFLAEIINGQLDAFLSVHNSLASRLGIMVDENWIKEMIGKV